MNQLNIYKINHLPVEKDLNFPESKNSKQTVRFKYLEIYLEIVKQYKIEHNLIRHSRDGYLPPCLRSFKVFLDFNNLWWLFKKYNLTERDKESLGELNIKIYK